MNAYHYVVSTGMSTNKPRYLYKAIYPSMQGYARLASLMGAHPDVAIVRRFATLNTLNLLYLQAEIVALESDLRKYTTADERSSDPNRAIHSRDWYTLSQSSNHGGDAGMQWQTVIQIREKLNEYSVSEPFPRVGTQCAIISRPCCYEILRFLKTQPCFIKPMLLAYHTQTLATSHFCSSG